MRLEGKIALITGAASNPGLGSATAFRFAREGASLLLTDVDGAGAERVAEQVRGEGGVAQAMPHDVTKTDQWDAVFERLRAAYGRLDVLVNNVGIAIPNLLVDATPEEWFRMHDINVTGAFHGCQRAVRMMRDGGGGGSIINISSIAGNVGMPAMSGYCASKAGVRLLSKALALETAGDAIRVNSVHPGIIRTQHHIDSVSADPSMSEWMKAKIPMGHFGHPDDIANMNLFLASDEARYVTAGEFIVDGGYTAA